MIRIEGIGESQRRVKPAAVKPAVEHIDAFDWQGIGRDLDQQGNAMMEQLLSPEECRGIADLYPKDDIFRSRVVMGRHGFGRGEYKYFSYPLPDLPGEFRTAVYRIWSRSPIAGMTRWESMRAIRNSTPTSSSVATMPVRCGRRRFSFNMESTTTTACTRTSTGACLPAPAGCSAVRPRHGFHRRRVHHDGAAPAHAEPTDGRAASSGRRSYFRGSQPPCAGYARYVSREPAARGQPRPFGAPSHRRHHFPRCDIKAGPMTMSLFEDPAHIGLSEEPLAQGATILRNFTVTEETEVLSGFRDVVSVPVPPHDHGWRFSHFGCNDKLRGSRLGDGQNRLL